ncbi:hypothetical protein EYF80_065395 [Liparis tanakae]|uniref:Uncharacterized protein n=1 Tax=Liparis tanakae TaxID=230148 RepID=A0A4Z2E6T7_9TELE|nr:hypothetical protein EYF80_065395 [Liparis tanakae]
MHSGGGGGGGVSDHSAPALLSTHPPGEVTATKYGLFDPNNTLKATLLKSLKQRKKRKPCDEGGTNKNREEHSQPPQTK